MRLLFPIFLLLPILLFSQRETKRSRSELGLLFGGTYYIGDLNQTRHFHRTEPAAGLIYRFNVHSRLALRGNILYGTVSADDSESRYALHQNRNLSFRSTIIEVAGGLEFNYFPFQIGHPRYKATAYFLVEMGAFHFNPKTDYNGSEVELQPLGTEGQGTSLNSQRKYSRTQFTMPIGLGFRVTLGKRASLNIEYGIRKTFTDYLDDVGSSSYVNSTELALVSGQKSADLSNRSLNQAREGRRGNSSTSDWYAFAGMMLTFKMGQPKKCFFEPF